MIKKIFIYFILVLLFINLLFIDWKFFSKYNTNDTTQETHTIQVKSSSAHLSSTSGCSSSCVSDIYNAIYQATSSSIVQSAPEIIAPSPKEYFVPFGSSTSSSMQWSDVAGLQAYVDTGNYARIKQAFFEVSVFVPTGNETVNIRLYDATDQHPVWFSEVYFDSGVTPELLVSSPITLDQGNKLYVVQMETQLTYPAVLDQARLHIITYD